MGQSWSTFLVPGLPSLSVGSWPMLAAAKAGDHRHLVKYAQQEPLLLLACSIKGHSLAHIAAEAGHLSTLQLLVQLVQDKAERLSARLQEVLRWSEAGAELLKSMRSKPRQEHFCQLLDPKQILQALLSWQDIKGVTPLMLAARGGHADCLALLLQHGANPLLLDSVNRRSCLHYAAGAGHARCINLLVNSFVTVLQPGPRPPQQQQGQQPEPQQQQLVLLPEARVTDSIRGVTSFVDLRTRTGFSALHYATFWGFVGCAQALLTAGASIDLPANNPSRQHSELPVVNGCTALHLAADYGHTSIAALLLHTHVIRMAHLHPRRQPGSAWLPWEGVANMDPRIHRNGAGDTPLMLHENRCSPSGVMRMLLDAFVPVNRTLPLVLEAVFGGPPRLGVPALASLAKAALDSHLTGSLDQLEEEAAEAQQQQLLKRQLITHAAEPFSPDAEPCSTDELIPGSFSCERTHSTSSSCMDALTRENSGASVLCGCGEGCGPGACVAVSSAGSTPAASRCTSYGSISSLATSSCTVAGSSPCSTVSSLPRSGSSSSLASCSKYSAAGHARSVSIDSTIAESVGASSVDRTCSICFDASANVMMAGCCHTVCTGCARSLLERTSVAKPAVCPFCRAGLRGFVAAPCS